MARKKVKKASTNRYYYNDHDDNQVEQLRTKRQKRRIKKNVKRALVVCVILLVVGFFSSDLSRVSKITVVGQRYLTEEMVIKEAGISKKSFHILTYPYFIEKKLEQVPMIKNVKVSRGFFYGIKIKIEESNVLAYVYQDEKLRIVDDKGAMLEVSKDYLKDIQQSPRLVGFKDEKILQEFVIELAKIPEGTLALMSDIVFSPVEPYDKTRVEISMSDGKKVIIRIEDMASELKYYQEILSQEPNACVYDIYGNKVYASPCDD